MTHLTYTIEVHAEVAGGYTARIPALAGCVVCATTYEQTVSLARELLYARLEHLVLGGQPIPIESEHPRELAVTVPAPLPVIV